MSDDVATDAEINKELNTVLPKSYRDLIEEAYVLPIRSVLIVDDDFPTLEAFLHDAESKKPQEIERLKRLIAQCRCETAQWLVDVHDGSETNLQGKAGNLAHLHQSDLLILDYHLDGDERNEKAIEIIRQIAASEYFNLIVVYTKGYGGHAGDLTQVGYEIAQSLSGIRENLEETLGIAPTSLEEWEDDDPDIEAKLSSSVDMPSLIKAVNSEKYDWNHWKLIPEMGMLRTTIEERQREKRANMRETAEWIIKKKILQYKNKFPNNHYGDVNFSVQQDCVWVRADRVFLAVIGKQTQPEEIRNRLLDSLVNWNPSPHRLLMAKLRAELDTYGVGAESTVLARKYIQAGWMRQLLEAKGIERPWRIRDAAAKHLEEMSGALHANIQRFASALCDAAVGQKSADEVIHQYTGINLLDEQQEKQVKLQLNRYVCSKEVEGHHLMPGHILEIAAAQKTEYWLCLSPACDLVPGQSQRWGDQRSHQIMPFKAVLLHTIPPLDALKIATSNEMIFVEILGKLAAFKFVDGAGSNPRWEQMFASNNGIIEENWKIDIARLAIADGKIVPFNASVKVVAQLRYEYALNLLQRLGNSLSRVGLDFVKHE